MVCAGEVGNWVGKETLFAGNVCDSEMSSLWQCVRSVT